MGSGRLPGMGYQWLYRCHPCEYETHAAGGPTALFGGAQQTMVCGTCRQLVNVQIATRTSDEEGYVPVPHPEQRCPHCKGQDLSHWDLPACPRCGTAMEEIDTGLCID